MLAAFSGLAQAAQAMEGRAAQVKRNREEYESAVQQAVVDMEQSKSE